MGSEGLKDERDVYCLWNPSQEVEDYWDQQRPAIDRRLILQLKYEPRHHDSIAALRTMYKVLTRVPLENDPFDLLSEFLEDSTFLTASSFFESHDRSFDERWLAATLITRKYLARSFPESVTHTQLCEWMDAAIRFFPALCELVTRFTRLFTMQNPDLLANAPERGRLWYMEWGVANSVVRTVKQLVNDDHAVAEESEDATDSSR